MSELKVFHLTPQTQELAAASSLAEALEAARTGGFLWVDYRDPTSEQLSALAGPLGLHPLSIEDCTDENQVPKIEDFPHYAFLVFDLLGYSEQALTIEEMDLFVGRNFVVTVSGHAANGRPSQRDITRVVARDLETARQGPAFLLHTVLDYIVDEKSEAIETIEGELDRVEEAMLADVSRFDPSELLNLRRDILALRKNLFQEREILIKICRKDCPFISEQALFHYRDIYDHLARFFELTETSRDVVTSLMEIYLSLLNNEMARTANATNASVRRLTLITTIFMPLTLLAGIGGMSEWTMMTGQPHWQIAYPIFLLGMAAIGTISFHVLRRLERKD